MLSIKDVSNQEKAQAWDSVFEAIDKIDGKWFTKKGSGRDLAVKFIEEAGKIIYKPKKKEGTPESAPFGKRFFGHKIKVTPETSKMIQKAVFEAGGKWGGSGDTYFKFPQDTHLEINPDGVMWRQSWQQIDPSVPELVVELEVVKSLKIVDVIPAKTPEQLQKEARLVQVAKLEEEIAKLKSLEE